MRVVWNRQQHFPCNVAWSYYETAISLPCLNSAVTMTWNIPRFRTLCLNWCCVERTQYQFRQNFARVWELLSLVVPVPMQAKLSEVCTLSRVCRAVLQCSASWREDTVSSRDCFVLQIRLKFYLPFAPTRLWQN